MHSKMSFRLLVIAGLLTVLIPLGVTTPGVYGDGDDNQYPIPEKSELKYPNLGYHLDQLVTQVEAGEVSAEEATEDASMHREESVAVTIHLSGTVEDVVSFLEDNGGSPRNVGEDYIEAYVPVSLLGELSGQPGVLRVREVISPQPAYGDFTSQGVQVHLSEAWNQVGFSGQGIKVGVIDLGFEGFRGLGGIELPKSGDLLHENNDIVLVTNLNSRIQETLAAGTYTIEATTYSVGQMGSFTLTVSGLGDVTTPMPPPGPMPTDDPCRQTLPGDDTVTGDWADDCESAVGARGYARYYSFTLAEEAEESEVTITLESDTDPYLYLREGEVKAGAFLHENDDIVAGTNTNSRIQVTLVAGTYTIEATTYSSGETGSFTLTVSGLGDVTTPTPTPEPMPTDDPCRQTLSDDGTVTGEWASSCESTTRMGSYARYYSFMLAQETEVTITLESSIDTYLYLREGEATNVKAMCFTDLGRFTRNLSDCEDDGDHGTAVAETLIDVAPEVSLYIAKVNYKGDLQSAVEWMVSQGVSVINSSIIWTFDGPGDGTSPFSYSPLTTVDLAVEKGVVWINSAGNSARRTWFSPAVNEDGDTWLEFDPQIERNYLTLETGDQIGVQLRWEGPWGREGTDLDVILYDSDLNLLELGNDSQRGSSAGGFPTPQEYFRYEVPVDGEYFLAVRHNSGLLPEWIQLVVWGPVDAIEHYTNSGSMSNPAESKNRGMLAVGATNWEDPFNILPYSSRGPTPDGRAKPDIVGASCGKTTYRVSFCGTSQAAPHIAGMAALVRQRIPNYSPAAIVNYIKEHAIQRDSPDPNNTWGHGFAQLPPPLPPAAPTVNTPITAQSDWMTVTWNPPPDDGREPITSYDLRYLRTGADETVASNWTLVEEAGDPGMRQHVITGLIGATPYSVQIRANNLWGGGEWSATAVGTTLTEPPEAAMLQPIEFVPQVPGQDSRITLKFITPSQLSSIENSEVIFRFHDDFSVTGGRIDVSKTTIQANSIFGGPEVDTPKASGVVNPTSATVTYETAGRNLQVALVVPDMADDEGDQHILANAVVTVVFQQGSGLMNPSKSGSYGIEYSVNDDANLMDLGDVIIPVVVNLSGDGGKRGTSVTVVAKGVEGGEAVLFWLDTATAAIPPSNTANGPDGIYDPNTESVLCRATAESNDTAICVFEVQNPPFAPGVDLWVNVQDSEGRRVGILKAAASTGYDWDAITGAGQSLALHPINEAEVKLDARVTISPSEVNIGDTVTVSMFDYAPGGTIEVIIGSVRLDLMAPGVEFRQGASEGVGQQSFTFVIPATVGGTPIPLGLVRVDVNVAAGTAGDRTADTNITIFEAVSDPLVARYDTNDNGTIEKGEVIAAINDYLFGEGDGAISKAEVIELINLYLFG